MKILVMKATPEKDMGIKQPLDELASLLQKRYASPGTQLVCEATDELVGGGAIHSKQMGAAGLCGFSHYLLTPGIVKKALEAQERGFDAVVVTNNNDPGVEAARFAVRIPMLGAGKATCHLAATLADRVGIIVPFDTSVPNVFRLLKLYGLSGYISSIVPANPPVGKEMIKEKVFDCFEKAGKKCLQEGAQIIVPLCGVFIPMTLSAKELSDRVGIQVMDCYAVAIGLAELMVRLGITHSEKAYPALVKIMSSDIGAPSRG